MDFTDFLDWDSGDRSGRTWELRDGVPLPREVNTLGHGILQSELAALIGNHCFATGSACRVLIGVSVMPRVRAAENLRVPDICVTDTPPTGARYVQAPVMLVEILSTSNADKVYGNVWCYATIPSVQEILIISSTRVAAELLQRGADGEWPDDATLLTGDDVLELASIGMELRLADAYRTTDIA